MNTNDPRFELLRRHHDGEATPEDLLELESLLRHDTPFRETYVRYKNLDVALGAVATTISPPLKKNARPLSRWLQWRPLTAAAAGIIIGAFSASAVWAIAATNSPRSQEREVALVDGGFEQSPVHPPLYMPKKFGFWGGDPVEVVSEFQGIKPRSGQGMVRFLASAMTAEYRPQSNAADLWQVVPLPGSGNRLVRIRAWFCAVGPASFSIGAAAGAEGPESAWNLWDARVKDDPRVLAAGMKSFRFTAKASGWQVAELTFQVPDQARVLVIDLAAARMSEVKTHDGFPGQFLDDVSVTISDEPVTR
jgi:hypothetical protein